MAHNMTIFAEISWRDPRHCHVLREQPENDPGTSRQRDGGRRRRAKVSKESDRPALLSGGQFCVQLDAAHVERSSARTRSLRRKQTFAKHLEPGLRGCQLRVGQWRVSSICSASRCGRATLPCATGRCCVGLKSYFNLWFTQRGKIACGNLFYFSASRRSLGAARPNRLTPWSSTNRGRSGWLTRTSRAWCCFLAVADSRTVTRQAIAVDAELR